jgi:hypothetical protein
MLDLPPMNESEIKRPRVGHRIEDWCRPCKSFRAHTITLVSSAGDVQRVQCDTCGSQHNFRGHAPRQTSPTNMVEEPRSPAPMTDFENVNQGELESLLRRVIREESGITPVAPAEKWRGGEMVLRPGKPGLQEKSIPIDTVFQKIVAIRNKLRVLEQQVNGSDLPADAKLKLQGYITGCYGSLTSFNVLFARDEDRFKGTGAG